MNCIKMIFFIAISCILTMNATALLEWFADNLFWNDAFDKCGVPHKTDRYDEYQSRYSNQTVHHNSLKQYLRIFNGENVESGKIPWIVGLYHVPRGHICGGVIITRRHFITAAHCLDADSNWQNYYTRASSLIVDSGDKYNVTKCVRHWRYDKMGLYHDIAVCKFQTKIEFTSNVSPICLPRRRMTGRRLTGELVRVSGYGASNSKNPEKLKQSEITVIPNRQCFESYRKLPSFRAHIKRRFRNNLLCAGRWEGGRDACDGDSGGPLAYFHNGRWYLVGIVGYGYVCGWPEFPGLYTSIAEYKLWIKYICTKL